jgi:DNA-binding transcriptional regulator YiaG
VATSSREISISSIFLGTAINWKTHGAPNSTTAYMTRSFRAVIVAVDKLVVEQRTSTLPARSQLTQTPQRFLPIRRRRHRSYGRFARVSVFRKPHSPHANHMPIGTLRDWEQARKHPDAPALAYLRVIAKEPDMTARALAVTG